MSHNQEVFTLSAGPTMATHRTLAALGQPIVYHYDPLFLDTFRRTQEKAARVFKTSNDMLLMQGEVTITQNEGGEPVIYRGFQMINEEKLRGLRGDQLRRMMQSGLLPLVHAHLFSLGVMREIFARQVAQGFTPNPGGTAQGG